MKTPGRDEVAQAWAFWVQTNMSFGKTIGGGFGFSQGGLECASTSNKKKDFRVTLSQRLAHVEIFSRDALSVIALKDAPDTLFYLDPPYVSSDCGHYKGYTRANWEELLHTLTSLQGRFVLSSYPEPEFAELLSRFDWHQDTQTQQLAVSGKRNAGKTKQEVITTNFLPITKHQTTLFT